MHMHASERSDGLPTVRAALAFKAKAALLRLRRWVFDGPVARHPREDIAKEDTTVILGQSLSPLWANAHPAEMDLTAGKVQNLRVACRALHGTRVPAEAVCSFWKQVGRATARRGFVRGRELREGCLVPAIGGGLCQLSNALYDAALNAGLEIVERHAHTRVVAGSLAEKGRDATVFWNYVDLRLRASQAFVIEAFLTKDELVVRLRGERDPVRVHAENPEPQALLVDRVHNCLTCGETGCFRNDPHTPAEVRFGKTAFLVDAYWPEFGEYMSGRRHSSDVLFLPLDGRRFGKANYAWPIEGFEKVGEARLATFARSIALRRLPKQGRVLQAALLRQDERLARSFAARLPFTVKHVVVSQNLLPFLWRDGVLGGRTFDVLMTRLPVAALQRTLDRARNRHPASPTLGDFRAPDWLERAETEALRRAEKIITPHAEIAAPFQARAELLEWDLPVGGNTLHAPEDPPILFFPASPLARAGWNEFREALRAFPKVRVMVLGKALEHESALSGVATVPFSADWPQRCAAAILPAYVAHQPRPLLRALAYGVPVIASRACGLGGLAGVTTLHDITADSIRHCLAEAFCIHAGGERRVL